MLTSEEIKKLRIFAKYCQSYGATEVEYIARMDSYDGEEFNEGVVYPRTGGGIQLYSGIEELLQKLMNEYVIPQYNTVTDDVDTDVYGGVSLVIDLINKKITASGYYWGTREDDSVDELDINEYADRDERNEIYDFFTECRDLGFQTAEATYSGGGDSGEIHDNIKLIGKGKEESIDMYQNERFRFLKDYLYDVLESSYGGWEINEGSSGKFILNFTDFTATIEHTSYSEEQVDVDIDLELTF